MLSLNQRQLAALSLVLVEAWILADHASEAKTVIGKNAVSSLRESLELFELSLGGVPSERVPLNITTLRSAVEWHEKKASR